MKMIPLTQGKVAKVDDGDYEWLSQRKWTLNRVGKKMYAIANFWIGKKTKLVYMHRYILGESCKGMVTDHKDGDSLNNQRGNLRVCTQAENLRNRKKPNLNNYKYKGIAPRGKKWLAVIQQGKTMKIGTFDTPEEAARAYDKKAKELFGEFARLNFPE